MVTGTYQFEIEAKQEVMVTTQGDYLTLLPLIGKQVNP